MLVFPTNAVCASFYRELRNPYATHVRVRVRVRVRARVRVRVRVRIQAGVPLTRARLALDRHFPNRYASYLETGGFSDAKKALELSGILRNGVVAPEFVSHPALPSAPLRAFSYTMAGG